MQGRWPFIFFLINRYRQPNLPEVFKGKKLNTWLRKLLVVHRYVVTIFLRLRLNLFLVAGTLKFGTTLPSWTPSPTMSTEVDPLLALRQAIKSRTQITYSNDSGPCSSLLNATQLVLSDKPFPKAGRTRYRKPDTPSEFYLLDALYVAWLLREAPGAEYMKQLREHGLSAGFVSVTERKHVTDWLEGKISDNERIAPLACEYRFFLLFKSSC